MSDPVPDEPDSPDHIPDDHGAILKSAAVVPPSPDSPEWAALGDWYQERRDCRWVAVNFIRHMGWDLGPIVMGGKIVGHQVNPDKDGRSFPQWWSMRCAGLSEPTLADAYGIMLDGFASAYHRGEVPPMFLYANGVRDMPEWMVPPPMIVKYHGEADLDPEELRAAGERATELEPGGVMMLPRDWSLEWPSTARVSRDAVRRFREAAALLLAEGAPTTEHALAGLCEAVVAFCDSLTPPEEPESLP